MSTLQRASGWLVFIGELAFIAVVGMIVGGLL
jgi:hypothetical protein